MTILSAQSIRVYSKDGAWDRAAVPSELKYLCSGGALDPVGPSIARHPLITPFAERTVERGMTYGLSSCGYDVRLDCCETECIIADTSMRVILASTIEMFDLPNWLCMRVLDKSTWARRGLFVQNTIAEPGWRGYLTLEITNCGRESIRLWHGMPIAQVVFEELDQPTEQPYPRDGKYQNQRRGPVGAITDKERA